MSELAKGWNRIRLAATVRCRITIFLPNLPPFGSNIAHVILLFPLQLILTEIADFCNHFGTVGIECDDAKRVATSIKGRPI
jgi:hypothetical protein